VCDIPDVLQLRVNPSLTRQVGARSTSHIASELRSQLLDEHSALRSSEIGMLLDATADLTRLGKSIDSNIYVYIKYLCMYTCMCVYI